MFEIKGVRTFATSAKNIDRSVEFYTKIVGGEVVKTVAPFDMYKAIRSIGVEHVTLSSDCGEPLFPNSVEGMRQMCAYMRAFGLSPEEVKTVSCDNPAKILGLPPLR